MSRHEGVSCDFCLKGNFRGRRYKCLICYDYDLCSTCYEAGATTTRHTTDHPMQCIIARGDFDLYYGGEAVSVEQPQAFTCPFCSKMGFNEQTLQEHVTSEHADTSLEVVCPVCAALPGGDPNQVTDDFAAHLSMEHRTPRDLISFADEGSESRHVRRIPHPGRGVTGTRNRRSNMNFNTSGLASLSPSSRDNMDPIAELLSQLSGVRRNTTNQSNTSSQLQQLQAQLQLERQQVQAARQQLERLPRRQVQPSAAAPSGQPSTVQPPPPVNTAAAGSQFLLSRCTENNLTESEQESLEIESSDRSLFVQELLVHTLAENLFISVTPPSSARPETELNPAPNSSTSAPLTSQSKTSPPAAFSSGSSSSSSKKSSTPPAREVPSSKPAPVKPTTTTAAPARYSSGTGTVREFVSSPAPTNSGRQPIRATSPSSRRKVPRHVDSRNQPNEPPPPH